jgi:hypothetical protein
MNIFRRPDYRSDATLFLNRLKSEKPALEAEQLKGRSLLWDKVIDRLALKGFRSARVPQKPYVYQTNHD